MPGRTWVVAAMTAALCAPVAAWADHEEETAWCMPAPVGTVGLHAEVGTEELHVPALTDVALCVDVPSPVGQSAPTEFTQYQGCGIPCFRVMVAEGPWTVASTRVSVYLRYKADGVPTVVPLVNEPVWVGADNPNRVCVSMGNPIPECPSNSIAVPIPGL